MKTGREFKKFQTEEIDIMRDMYLNQFLNLEKIWKHFKTCKKVIQRIFKENSIKTRSHGERAANRIFCNQNYFEKINSHEKAQVLGFLFSDGCVSGNCIAIGLSPIDYSYLFKIKNSLNSDHPIHFREKNSKKPNPSIHLSIKSQILKSNLISLGCVPAKSLILKFPDEQKLFRKFVNSFILGYFEGDGSIYIKKNLHAVIEIVGTKEFIEELRKITIEELNIKGHFRKCDKNNDKNTYKLSIGGNQQVLKFFRWAYKDANFVMSRKYNKFKEIEDNFLSGRIITNKKEKQ